MSDTDDTHFDVEAWLSQGRANADKLPDGVAEALGPERDLLPCPWCDKPVMHRHALHVSDGNTDDIIHAAPTDCGMQVFSIGTADRGVSVGEAWNARCRPISNDTVTDELVEAVAEALLSAFLAGRGSITARERNAHKPEPEMGHFRSVARATLANEATQ